MERGNFTYATREDVKFALDVLETTRADAQIDRNLRTGSDNIEGILHRKFYPLIDTRRFDWPNYQYSAPWRLWLESNELISVTQLVSGGVTLTEGTDFFLRRADGKDKPPYTFIEINLDSDQSFSAGPTFQRSIVIDGLFGYSDQSQPAGTIQSSINDTVTDVTVTNGALIGIGDLMRVATERMIVTGRQFVTSSETITSQVEISTQTIPVTDGSVFNQLEIILIGSEQMLITEVTGNNLTVKRGWNGSLISVHTNGTTVFVSRRLTVVRGAMGTTTASHSGGASVTTHVVPPLVKDLAIGEALVNILQQRTGMARTVKSADTEQELRGVGLADLRKQAKIAYGRKARIRAI